MGAYAGILWLAENTTLGSLDVAIGIAAAMLDCGYYPMFAPF